MTMLELATLSTQAKPIDIETLLQWAYGQTAYVSCRNGSERSLAYNHGYTAIPKGCHGIFSGGDAEVQLRSAHAVDARTVLDAVDTLDPWTRAIVTRSAKAMRRPDCFLGVEAREVVVKTYPKRRKRGGGKRRSHVPVFTKRWEPCHPQAICAAREIYARWHAALGRLAQHLAGDLTDWSITGFSAPARPWEIALEKSA